MEEGIPRVKYLPKVGLTNELIKENLLFMKQADSKASDRLKISGTLYNTPSVDEITLQKMVMDFYYKTNPLHADIFPSLITMEKDIVSITKNLFNCPKNSGTGTVTTGGTESIILALFGYRELAKKRGITNPEIIAPSTAHPALTYSSAAFTLVCRMMRTRGSGMAPGWCRWHPRCGPAYEPKCAPR